MNLADPLSDEELQELEDFLLSDAAGEDCMDLSMLDGFLTAIAIAPRTLGPSQWLPAIWGGEMTWESKQQAERIMSLIFRHANDILFLLREEPEAFEPLLYERDEKGEATLIMDEWCTGFVEGMALDEEGWRPLLDSDVGEDLLYPILLYGTEQGWEELRNNPDLDERHTELAESLSERIAAIQARMLPLRKAFTTVRREAPKHGRNELCPCGSGRKFKKCCGAPDRLH